MRRLSAREVAVCTAGGALAGFGCRPRYARLSTAFLPADEVLPAVLCTVGGVAVFLGVYVLFVWWRGW